MMNRTLCALVLCAGLATAQSPLPLHQGNMWEYRSTDPMDPIRLRMAVTGDTVLPNARTYAVLSGSLFTSPFLRVDSARVYAYSTANASEFRLFDFLAQPGDTIAYLDGGSQTILLRSTWFDTTSNRQNWYFILYWGTPPTWYEFLEWWIQDSLGLTSLRAEPGNSWYLTGARIAGDTVGTLTAVKERGSNIPTHPVLAQNYPNPFNPSTNIEFQIPHTGHVSLKVFDVLGREVATLVNEEMTPGRYGRLFDAGAVGSGVYFYTLSSGSVILTKKMIIMR